MQSCAEFCVKQCAIIWCPPPPVPMPMIDSADSNNYSVRFVHVDYSTFTLS